MIDANVGRYFCQKLLVKKAIKLKRCSFGNNTSLGQTYFFQVNFLSLNTHLMERKNKQTNKGKRTNTHTEKKKRKKERLTNRQTH